MADIGWDIPHIRHSAPKNADKVMKVAEDLKPRVFSPRTTQTSGEPYTLNADPQILKL